MKKLLSLSVMLSLGLITVTPALNAAQSQQDAVAQSQANPAHVSGWQAAKKWWQSGRNMKALNPQEQRAFNALKKKFTIGTIIAAIVAIIGGGAAYLHRRSAGGAAGPAPRATGPVVAPAGAAGYLEGELRYAAGEGNKAEVKRLLDRGANVNAVGQNGYTALILAADRGHENIVELLLDKGADVNAVDSFGYTALMAAAGMGYGNIVDRLLQEKGIEVNVQGEEDGITALMSAAIRGYENIVELLLDKGANKDLQNRDGLTAAVIARLYGHGDLADMIRDYVRSGRLTKSAGKKGKEEENK